MRAFVPCQLSRRGPVSNSVRRVITILTAAALVAASLPALAMAQGNSGVDEYEEVLPNPGGGNDSDAGDNVGDDSSGPLTPEQASALEEQGSDGAAAPAQESGGAGNASSATDSADTSSGASSSDDDSGVASVVGDLASGSDDGMGIVLPIVLVVAVVAAVGFLFARRRGRAGAARPV